jgi:hypothetical protein
MERYARATLWSIILIIHHSRIQTCRAKQIQNKNITTCLKKNQLMRFEIVSNLVKQWMKADERTTA